MSLRNAEVTFEGDNLALARALAPSVFAHIMRTENDI